MPLDIAREPTEDLEDETVDDSLTRFLDDIIIDADPMQEQRDSANEDTRFTNKDGGMWEGWLEDEFDEKRAKLELDLVSDFLNRAYGEWTLNRVGVDFKPTDQKTSDKDALMLNGIYRANFRDGSGKVSTDSAVLETFTCGYGCFKLATAFEEPENPENDKQIIEWRPIHNAYSTVFWDLSAKRIDKADARRCTVLTEFSRDSFEQTYPEATPVSAYEPEDRREMTGSDGNSQEGIFIATRYHIIKKREKVFVYNNLQTGEVETYNKEDHDEIKEVLVKDEAREFVRERPVIRQHVEKSVFSGAEYLEEPHKIPGKWIPVIPMYGYRAFVDGTETYRGVVRKLKDASRLFNMQVSQLAENSASSGQSVPIFDPDQMPDDFDLAWSDKNNASWLPAKALRDDDGKVLHIGPIAYSNPGTLDQSAQVLMQTVPNFIQTVTGGAPQETLNPKTSGKAINAILRRVNLNLQTINDNVANAIEWSGTVFEAMAAEVFNEQRIMRVLSKEGIDSSVQLRKTELSSETGMPVETNVLKGMKFKAYADTSPQYDSLQEQAVEDMLRMAEVIKGTPMEATALPVIFSVMTQNISGPGIEPLKRMTRRNMLAQGIVQPENDEEKAFVQQAQQAQQQPKPQDEYLKALAEESRGNAVESMAEAKKTESEVIENLSSAQKTRAETAQIQSEIKNDKVKLLIDIRKQVFDTLKQLPVGAGK